MLDRIEEALPDKSTAAEMLERMKQRQRNKIIDSVVRKYPRVELDFIARAATDPTMPAANRVLSGFIVKCIKWDVIVALEQHDVRG